eukprot:6982735-Pyramimonas_sp.AAC.1
MHIGKYRAKVGVERKEDSGTWRERERSVRERNRQAYAHTVESRLGAIECIARCQGIPSKQRIYVYTV